MKKQKGKIKKGDSKGETIPVGQDPQCLHRSAVFRVFIGQVNQTFVDVKAKDEEAARDKAYRKWRREDAHAAILSVGKPDGRMT